MHVWHLVCIFLITCLYLGHAFITQKQQQLQQEPQNNNKNKCTHKQQQQQQETGVCTLNYQLTTIWKVPPAPSTEEILTLLVTSLKVSHYPLCPQTSTVHSMDNNHFYCAVSPNRHNVLIRRQLDTADGYSTNLSLYETTGPSYRIALPWAVGEVGDSLNHSNEAVLIKPQTPATTVIDIFSQLRFWDILASLNGTININMQKINICPDDVAVSEVLSSIRKNTGNYHVW